MKSNLKPGITCIVLPGAKPFEAVGTCVKLLRFIGEMQVVNDSAEYNGGRPFAFRFPVWECDGNDFYGFLQPQHLMPIDGDDFSNELLSEKERSHG